MITRRAKCTLTSAAITLAVAAAFQVSKGDTHNTSSCPSELTEGTFYKVETTLEIEYRGAIEPNCFIKELTPGVENSLVNPHNCCIQHGLNRLTVNFTAVREKWNITGSTVVMEFSWDYSMECNSPKLEVSYDFGSNMIEQNSTSPNINITVFESTPEPPNVTNSTGDTNSTGGMDPTKGSDPNKGTDSPRDTGSSGSTRQTVHTLLLSVLTAVTLLQLAG